MTQRNNQYVLGRGKTYFDKFEPDTETPTGERYLGNTPSVNLATAYQNLDHYSADEGLSLLDDSVTLRTDRTGTFTCDVMSVPNIALWWGRNDAVVETTAPTVGVTETLTAVRTGIFYQLGVSADVPQGVGSVANVVVELSGDPVDAEGNFTVDLVHGRIHILDAPADITEGDDLDITYDAVSEIRDVVIEDPEQVEGALRYIADNPKGPDTDYYWPHVKLTPSGDFALKGDTWQTMTFTFTVLTPEDGRKRVYVTRPRPAA